MNRTCFATQDMAQLEIDRLKKYKLFKGRVKYKIEKISYTPIAHTKNKEHNTGT